MTGGLPGTGALLVSAARTPVGKFGRSLHAIPSVDLAAGLMGHVVEPLRGRDPDHVYLGNVLQGGLGQNPARQVAVRGGLAMTVPATTLNSVCLASMAATGLAANLIQLGQISSAVVGGFDSMSRAMHGVQVREAPRVGDGQLVDLLVRDGLWCAIEDAGMGPISERANTALGVTRQEQDAAAAESHRRAAAATATGRLAREIRAVGDLSIDEGVRADTTVAALGALRPAFAPYGSITAGNASQMSDAAALGLVMSQALARETDASPLVEIVGHAVVGGTDTSLHLRPADAAQRVLDRHGLSAKDIGLWEINEAFAGVLIASERALALDPEQVNVNGGAIAIGHPLGASGFRIVMSLAIEMQLRDVEFGIATMCGGGGQGHAILLQRA